MEMMTMNGEADSGDDCAVDGDDDFDAANVMVDDEIADAVNVGMDDEIGVDEEGNLEDYFVEAARDDEVGSDGDSGDDIWDDERIPDPLSASDEDEDEEETEQERRENEDPVINDAGAVRHHPIVPAANSTSFGEDLQFYRRFRACRFEVFYENQIRC